MGGADDKDPQQPLPEWFRPFQGLGFAKTVMSGSVYCIRAGYFVKKELYLVTRASVWLPHVLLRSCSKWFWFLKWPVSTD